jgi:hypothetical protein
VSFNAVRPQWLESSARSKVPAAIADRQIDVIRVWDSRVYFGVRDYGIAVHTPATGAWELFPYDFSSFNKELIIIDIVPMQGMVYAGAAGGLLRLDTQTRAWTVFKNPRSAPANDIFRLAARNGLMWIATSDGLVSFDPASESFALIHPGPHLNVVSAQGALWGNLIDVKKPAICRINPQTRKLTGDWTFEGGAVWGIEMMAESGRIAMPKPNGLSFFYTDKPHFEFVYKPDEFPAFLATSIARYGDTYLLGTRSGLVQYDPQKNSWLLITRDAGLPSTRVTALAVHGGLIYMGFTNGALIAAPDMFAQMRRLAENPGKPAGANPDETVVSEDTGGVRPWRLVSTQQGLFSNDISALLGLEGATWVGSNSLGINSVALDTLEVKSYAPGMFPANDIPATPIMELAERDGVLWHGGYAFYGSFDVKKRAWRSRPVSDALLSGTDVEALWAGPGQVWMGVRKQGVRVLENGKWRVYTGDHISLSPFTTDIVQAEDALWLSGDIGLRRYNDKDDGFVYVDIGGVMDIESMAGDGGAALWLGCRERSARAGPENTGLYRYNVRTRHVVRFNELDNSTGARVNKVYVDGPFVWAAHEKGVSRYDRMTGAFTHYGPQDGLDAGAYLTLAVNADWLFVGTDQGLYARPILEFDSPADRGQYRLAWHMARKGDNTRAAALFAELASRAQGLHADYLAWRAAHCRALSGDSDGAWRDFQPLLKRHPMMLLDLDTLAAAREGLPGYVKRLDALQRTLPRNAYSWRLAQAWLAHTGPALEHFARKAEKQGDLKAAALSWNLILQQNFDPQLRKLAAAQIQRLDKR